MSADSVGVDQLLNSGRLIAVIRAFAVEVSDPANWLVWNSERRKDLIVEAIFTKKQSVNDL
jgi:hypothetical protein